MDPDEFAAVVTDVLATLEPPTLNTSTETAAFIAEAVERVMAVYPRPRRRALFGVRAVAEAAGLDGRQVNAIVESGQGHLLVSLIAG
jgi:hypothetical protein